MIPYLVMGSPSSLSILSGLLLYFTNSACFGQFVKNTHLGSSFVLEKVRMRSSFHSKMVPILTNVCFPFHFDFFLS